MTQMIFVIPKVFLTVDPKDFFFCHAPGGKISKDHHLVVTLKQKMMDTGVRMVTVKRLTPDPSLWTFCVVCRRLSTAFPFFWEVAMINQQGGM